jgi:DNA helicase IV
MDKEKILSLTREHLASTCLSIKKGLENVEKSLKLSKERFSTLSYADQVVESTIIANNEKRTNELNHLKGSPYFVRCDVVFNGEEKENRIYFGKFGFSDRDIYSWITPASAIRFEKPGDVSYKRPDGMIQKVKLLRKDQFMIVDKKIKFLSSETIAEPRELIYEEYFSTKKTGFILPEIVAQMEKAQDQVIRAYHKGPFLISGPAGSGKTTLALHRVAYLVQSPDLADIYTSKSIIVFVQDNGTKEYFSHLLPELGIDDVKIITFSEWALENLGINGTFTERYGDNEYEKDLYEFHKLKALNNFLKQVYTRASSFSVLEKAYVKHFDNEQKSLFQRQREDGVFDRIDLTLLLKMFYVSNKMLSVIRDRYITQRNGAIKKKKEIVPLEYSLAVIDEFQNYLPDQLQLIRSCISEKSQSTVYVGDMAQQVKLGTIRRWEDIEEKMEEDRKVTLQKVYRNTKNILRYIQKLGYDIEAPDQLKEGKEVGEYILESKNEEIKQIKKIISVNNFPSVGILAKEADYLVEFEDAFPDENKVHVMTMNEAQGVEFDVVIIVGVSKEMFADYQNKEHADLSEEKRRINRDLLYVALTRAISELHVMGQERLEDIVKK